ncbi:MAG: protein translocase subunit SecD [Lachnospirales bacterium]
MQSKSKSMRKIILFLILGICVLTLDFLNIAQNPLSIYHINQGLDLKGGVTIIYEADLENPTSDDMSAALSLMRRRLDDQGYTEADVFLVGDRRIQVDIPGVENSEEAIATIGATAQLMFLDESFQVLLTGSDVANAGKSVNGQTGQIDISLEFTKEGGEKFAKATAENIGKAIYIVLDDTMLSNATVNEAIPNGKAVISGDFTAQEAENIASLIRSGSLPFALNTISVENKGAKLGAEALTTSVFAGAIGIALVLLFMLLVYKTFGLVADIALLIYIGVDLLLLNVFNITLTLPGIAGIILSVGMAVDANVIIFERIKEELVSGKTLRFSIKSGFERASSAIIDGNITTLIAAVVLLLLGTGTIKGFATTLSIGIILSMFTALVITRILLNSLIGMGMTDKKFYGIKEEVK